MSLANCSRCGRVFAAVRGSRELCQACLKEEDDNYLKVFHFFTKCPSATAQEISQETGVDIKEIYRYVRENRLKLAETDTGLFCEGCGIPISQGRICEKCGQKLAQELKQDIDKYKGFPQKGAPQMDHRPDPKFLKDRRGQG